MDLTVQQSSSSTIIKHLASCNKQTRDRALKLLKTWLPTQPDLPISDMKLIWKGLFYSIWHSDKFLVQSELIDRLSSLLHVIDYVPLSVSYLSVFLLTIRREWSGIDALRLDKFYLLIRRFVFNVFVLLRKNDWDLGLVREVIGVIDKRVFSVDEEVKCNGNGVSYHVANVFLDEIKGFLPIRGEVMELFFGFFIEVMGRTDNKVLLGKIKTNVFDVLLKSGSAYLEALKSGEEIDSGDEVVSFGRIGLVMGFANKFYELGSSPDCLQGNRKVLFGLHHGFSKLESDLASSGVKVPIQNGEDEVPNLIPIEVANEMEVDGSSAKRSKKKKKKEEKKKKAKLLETTIEVEDVSTDNKRSKKRMKAEKSADGSKKKAKKDARKGTAGVIFENGSVSKQNGNIPDENVTNLTDENPEILDESVISNLQMQFEMIAAEAGLESNGASACESPEVTLVSKKRKRAKREGKKAHKMKEDTETADGIEKTDEKSAKKVSFSMKSNVVWKPQTPLPPQSVRLPPSVTPRGSALKQGIPAGPVRVMGPAAQKLKQMKKGKNGIKRSRK